MDRPANRTERNTRQRRVILEALDRPDYHPSAEEVYREARSVLPRISLGTVYRNLGYLRDQGRIREIRPRGGDGARYEAMRPLHAHFHCSGCALVHDVPLPDDMAALGWVRGERVGRTSSLEVHVTGVCAACAPPSPRDRT